MWEKFAIDNFDEIIKNKCWFLFDRLILIGTKEFKLSLSNLFLEKKIYPDFLSEYKSLHENFDLMYARNLLSHVQ